MMTIIHHQIAATGITTMGVREYDVWSLMFYVCADTMLMMFMKSFRCHFSGSLDGKAMSLSRMLSRFYDD